jgi:hypothetical protein
MEILLQKSYAVVNYNANKNLMCLHLIRNVNFNDYKKALNQLIEILEEQNTPHIIIDQRYVEGIDIQERAWLVTDWFDRFKRVAPDFLKMGIITSKNLYSKMGGEYIVNAFKSQSNFDIKFLTSMDEALVWFENK